MTLTANIKGKLLGLFRRPEAMADNADPGRNGEVHEFYFHEDLVGQEQFLPIEWLDYCRGEFAAIEEHSQAHLDPDGAGWTQMYTFKEAEPALPRLNMTEQRFHELLAPHSRRFDRLDSPLAAVDAELGIRAVGYGPSDDVGIIADLDGDKVGLLWGCLFSQDPAERRMLSNMLTALCADQHLLVVDWQDHQVADLRNPRDIEAYLKGGL